MHQAAVTNRRQNRRKRNVVSQNARAQIAFLERDGMARAQNHFLKRAAIFAQRHFVTRAPVHVVEYRARQTAPGQPAQILDIDHARRI